MADRPTCATCPWWARQDGYDSGQCRRHPPLLFLNQYPAACQYSQDHPSTDGGHWCGEHPDMPAWIARRGGA